MVSTKRSNRNRTQPVAPSSLDRSAAVKRLLATEVPHWIEQDSKRELTYLGLVVKHLRQPAAVQVAVFREFEKRAWARCLDNIFAILHLPPGWKNRKRYLHKVIQNLNANQHFAGIKFYADGTGNHLCWRPSDKARKRAGALLVRESS